MVPRPPLRQSFAANCSAPWVHRWSSAAKPTAKKKASATGEDAKSLVARAAPVAVARKNPKRGASGERFEKYMAATTAAEFLALGGTRADLKYDIARGWVTVLDPR